MRIALPNLATEHEPLQALLETDLENAPGLEGRRRIEAFLRKSKLQIGPELGRISDVIQSPPDEKSIPDTEHH